MIEVSRDPSRVQGSCLCIKASNESPLSLVSSFPCSMAIPFITSLITCLVLLAPISEDKKSLNLIINFAYQFDELVYG